jgi:hypothetical protein
LTNSQLPQHTSNCKQATNASRNSLLVSLREKHENPEKHGWDSVSSLNFLGVPPSTARLVAIILSSTLYPLLALVLIPLRHLSPCGVCAIPIASVTPSFLETTDGSIALPPFSHSQLTPLRKRREYMNGARNRVSLCPLVYLVLQDGGVETVVILV